MGFWEIIILIIWTAVVVIKIRRLERRVLFLEQRWAELQRRQSMYSNLAKPSAKALRVMGDFGIEDIEKAVDLHLAKKRTKASNSWLQRLLKAAKEYGRL